MAVDPTVDPRKAPEGPVVVVGGAGYIGSHTVRALEERGVDVVVFDNLSTGHREAVRGAFVGGDLRDRDALRRLFAEHVPRSVIHFAAKCYVGESMENPAKYYQENVVHTFHLLEEMRAAGRRRRRWKTGSHLPEAHRRRGRHPPVGPSAASA